MAFNFQNLRLLLLMIAWAAALLKIILGDHIEGLLNGAVIIYAIYLLITLPLIKRGSILIISFLIVLGLLTIHVVS